MKNFSRFNSIRSKLIKIRSLKTKNPLHFWTQKWVFLYTKNAMYGLLRLTMRWKFNRTTIRSTWRSLSLIQMLWNVFVANTCEERDKKKKMEYKTRQWHEKCFSCCVCKVPIGPLDQVFYSPRTRDLLRWLLWRKLRYTMH